MFPRKDYLEHLWMTYKVRCLGIRYPRLMLTSQENIWWSSLKSVTKSLRSITNIEGVELSTGIFEDLLRYYNLIHAQIHPHRWIVLSFFKIFFRISKKEPYIKVFRYFFSLISSVNGGPSIPWFFFLHQQKEQTNEKCQDGNGPSIEKVEGTMTRPKN